MKEIQWRCHVKIPVQFIQDNLLHSADFSWRTTTKAVPSQHLQYRNPLPQPPRRKKGGSRSLTEWHRGFIPVPQTSAGKGRAGRVRACKGSKDQELTSSSSMVFAARKKQLIAIQFRYFGRAYGTEEQSFLSQYFRTSAALRSP